MRLIDFTSTEPDGKGGLVRGVVLCVILVSLSLLLWAGFVLVWKPDAAAPWRNTTVDAIEAGGVKLPVKNQQHNATAMSTADPNQQDLSQDQLTAVATAPATSWTDDADLFNSDSEEHDTVVKQQVNSNEHQFNVTIDYTDDHCLEKFGHSVSVPIRFTHDTAALKSRSISALEAIVNIYHECVDQNINIRLAGPIAAGVRASLRQRREDEVRYFLLHMRVARDQLHLPDQQ